jgi:hypothetical protein
MKQRVFSHKLLRSRALGMPMSALAFGGIAVGLKYSLNTKKFSLFIEGDRRNKRCRVFKSF